MKYIFWVFGTICACILVWLVILYAQIRFDINPIIHYKPNLSTQFYDRNGDLVANIFQDQHRLYTSYEDIPPRIIEALVAIEDTQFFEHNGINPEAITRAIIKDIKAMKLVEGASTLTQQLIKTMVLTREKKIMRKIKEILLALRLETILTKEEILERYLNQIYFGHGYYGIRTASLGYFNKELDELSLKEIAILVGLPRAPSFYDPTRNLKFAIARANSVIKRMKSLGWINEQEYMQAMAHTPKVHDQTLTQNKAPYVIDAAIKELQKQIKDLKKGGYKIGLTIDLNAQKIAREAIRVGYEKIKVRDSIADSNESYTDTLNGALLSIDNHTGKVLALVGGVDYKKSSFNRAIQSKRQPGSAIKPFLYQIGLNLGYSTATPLVDISRTYSYKDDANKQMKWQPQNYEENFKGIIPLEEALVESRNLATINLVTDIGIDTVYTRLGFYGINDIPYDLSITLGSFSMSLMQMAQAYTIFSNNGIQMKPYLIETITNRHKQTLFFEPESTYITSAEQSFLMTSILKKVVDEGTGRNAQVNGLEIAGKTGTTNNNVDAWFCGYSPDIQTIVWYGNDDNKPMRRTETGGRSAGPAFSYFYKHYLKLHPQLQRRFTQPDGVRQGSYGGQLYFYTPTSKLPENTRVEESDYNEAMRF